MKTCAKAHMRKTTLITCLILLFLAAGCGSDRFTTVTFPEGRTVTCELADNQKSQIAGLTTYDSLPPDRGMLFSYPQEREGLSFWMPARMKFSIDMLFLDSAKRVVYIVRNAPICESNLVEECPSYGPPRGVMARYVIEVVAGFCDEEGITVGDTVRFELP